MIIRPYGPADREQVTALHRAQGLEYELPDLEQPGMLVRCVLEEAGMITHALFLRKTAEAYWVFGTGQSRRERLGRLLALHREATPAALRVGLEDVHCWVPPQALTPAMHALMLTIGWEKPEWACYSRKLKP